ncbi:hypothetical protein SAMN05216404_1355 [Nitrosospira multiformis]|uniref:Uncharacterized protein n=1 Tax=Nitrosospira multiformis TaxID=1231 RepID=A0A1H8QFF6_9PROT|nr:hypothetical protein SAMN05216404_1355 [Nitrosospira multiformis]
MDGNSRGTSIIPGSGNRTRQAMPDKEEASRGRLSAMIIMEIFSITNPLRGAPLKSLQEG